MYIYAPVRSPKSVSSLHSPSGAVEMSHLPKPFAAKGLATIDHTAVKSTSGSELPAQRVSPNFLPQTPALID